MNLPKILHRFSVKRLKKLISMKVRQEKAGILERAKSRLLAQAAKLDRKIVRLVDRATRAVGANSWRQLKGKVRRSMSAAGKARIAAAARKRRRLWRKEQPARA